MRRHAPKRKGQAELPALWFFTDPARVPDPLAVAARLPPGCGVVYRGFGHPRAEAEARALADLARRQGLILLIGLDHQLAERVGAHGVHLPERALWRARALRRRHPDWIITGAAHGARSVRAAGQVGIHAVFVSAVFPSNSPSAGQALGPQRFAWLARPSAIPVLALGGVRAVNVARLGGTGACGVAAIDGLATPQSVRIRTDRFRT